VGVSSPALMTTASNPLVSDAFVRFLMDDVLEVTALTRLPHFREHGRDTFELWVESCRRIAREKLWPQYRAMDAEPPSMVDGRVRTHPSMVELWGAMRDAGVLCATRPYEVGGQQLPLTVATVASLYLLAANGAAYAFAGLTSGAAHLIEAFGDEAVKGLFLAKMYDGTFTGTMALTEPQAGSSLADLSATAEPRGDGTYSIRGSKMFISGGDQTFAENTVHLVLARVRGAPAGTRGVSLFAVPRERPTASGGWEPNDVQVSGVIHKIGWRGIPSLALSFGDEGDCRGWLVGPLNHGLKCMFQMMNEARMLVGATAAGTASVAFHESVAYARERAQGRALGDNDPTSAPVAIVEHPDVRRMLLRQKCIVEGAIALVCVAARYADWAAHHEDEAIRERSQLMLDLLTPMAKTFPAERGFESNVLAVQVHGGYGYTSEYLPEAWMRDQKLNSIHEGTTGIQGLDLLGRKVIAKHGAALSALRDEIEGSLARAEGVGLPREDVRAVRDALARWTDVTMTLVSKGLAGDPVSMLAHATDYLDGTSALVVAWLWMDMASACAGRGDAFGDGVRACARYWVAHEVPRVRMLADVLASGDRSFVDLRPESL
jgi:alkylation response protein AidB-like acyl-CoA dehydrogenase